MNGEAGLEEGREGGMRPPRGGQPPSPPRARPLSGKETERIFSPFLTVHSLPSACLLGSFERRSGA